MTDDDARDLDDLLTSLARKAGPRSDPDEHPSPETLSAYRASELSAEEDQGVQEHLAECRYCTDLLLDLGRFLEPLTKEEGSASTVAFEAASHWRRLRERLAQELEPVHHPRSHPLGLLRSLRAAHSLAAALLLALIGLSIYTVSLQHRLVAPQAVRSFKTLDSIGGRRSAEPGREVIELPAVLVFSFPEDLQYRSYQADFLNDRSQLVLSSDALTQYSPTTLLIQLPAGSLAPGDYGILVWGLRGKQSHKLGRFQVSIHGSG